MKFRNNMGRTTLSFVMHLGPNSNSGQTQKQVEKISAYHSLSFVQIHGTLVFLEIALPVMKESQHLEENY